MVGRVSDIEITREIQNDGRRPVQLRTHGWNVVAIETESSGPGDRGDNSSRRHLADALIA